MAERDRGASRDGGGRSVVVTGASTGIGLGTARVLVGRGVRVFASVRRMEDAERLRAELGARVTPLLFDVVDEEAVRAAAGEVRERLGGRTLWGLVNNAGIAIGGPLLHQPIEEVRRQLEVNVIGALVVTQAFAPLLGADRTLAGPPGRIVNVSSIAGKMGMPFLGAYVATKHALEGLSESLRRELLLYGIDVIVVGPGSVATPIWDKAEAADASLYAGTDYASVLTRFQREFIARGRRGYPPERVGEVVWRALSARRPRLRYAVAGAAGQLDAAAGAAPAGGGPAHRGGARDAAGVEVAGRQHGPAPRAPIACTECAIWRRGSTTAVGVPMADAAEPGARRATAALAPQQRRGGVGGGALSACAPVPHLPCAVRKPGWRGSAALRRPVE